MTKLHELLAVGTDLMNQARACRADLLKTFASKLHHFTKKRTTFQPFQEGAPETVEADVPLSTTVPKELEWLAQKYTAAIDVDYAADVANTLARGDILRVDGTILVKDLPATTLLQLEKRLNEFREVIAAAPTFDPAKNFQPDSATGTNVWKADPVRRTRTQKTNEILTLHPGTEKHAPQVQVMSVDKPIGTIVEQEWSGAISTSRKAKLLDRVEEMIRAVKKARARANMQEVDVSALHIGHILFNELLQ